MAGIILLCAFAYKFVPNNFLNLILSKMETSGPKSGKTM